MVNFFKTADMCVVVWLLLLLVLLLLMVVVPSCFEFANWPKISLLFADIDDTDEDDDDLFESDVVITLSIGIDSSASKSRTIAERS